MGEAWPVIPDAVRRAHSEGVTAGVFSVEYGKGALARFAGFPPPGENVPICLRLKEGGRRWERDFNGHRLCSVQRAVEYKGRWLVAEKMDGQAIEVWMQVQPYTNGLTYTAVAARLWGIPVPPPKVTAKVVGDIPGRVLADIDVHLPLIGRLVRYHGWLEVVVEDEELGE